MGAVQYIQIVRLTVATNIGVDANLATPPVPVKTDAENVSLRSLILPKRRKSMCEVERTHRDIVSSN